ncbi:MAG: hypothetical protein R6V50_03055 [Thermoplasmatota archaeon]
MKNLLKNNSYILSFFVVLIVFLILYPYCAVGNTIQYPNCSINYDPLVDIHVNVTIKTIRSLEIHDDYFHCSKTIIREKPPGFYLVVWINDEFFESPIWPDSHIVYPNISFIANVSNYEEFVSIQLGLYEKCDHGEDILWDITHRPKPDYATITYSIATGHWIGDDYQGDISGYGRLNGYDDENYNKRRQVAEVFFDISQTDYDGDGIPYWTEVHILGTDPTFDDTGIDYSGDGIPIEWEYKWGYDPFIWYDHKNLDPDEDGLSNYEEYLTAEWGSDPFRADVFLEIDYMQDSDWGHSNMIPEDAIEMLHYPFHRRNHVIHIEISDILPFKRQTNLDDLLFIYQQYFLHNDSDNWRRGVFHYGVFVYRTFPGGYAFSGDVPPHMGYHAGTNAFVISSSIMSRYARWYPQSLSYFFASATMHELGHNFGFRWGNPYGVDAQLGKYPWQPMYYVYRNYKSIMNYRYTYHIFDYSDGNNGFLDHDDWSALDLTYFLIP